MSLISETLDPLTQEVLDFQRTGQNYPELFQKIALKTYHFGRKRFAGNHDKACDFYLSQLDHLEDMIRRFKYTGKPFENYLGAMLTWKSKTQLKNLGYRDLVNPPPSSVLDFDEVFYVQESPSWTPDEGDTQTQEELYRTLSQRPQGQRHSMELRMLMLLLKCAWEVEPDQVEDFAKKTRFKIEVIQDYLCRIKDLTLDQKLRRDALIQKRNQAWEQMQKYAHLLSHYPDRSDRWSRLLRFYQRRIPRIQRALEKISLSPTHQQIADVLELRKGTVDSSLFYFRNFMEKVSKPREKSYTCPHGNSYRIRKSS